MGEGRGHSGRTGPRLRRGLAGRLCPDHHRSRSDPVRPAVRALPQSGARVDARLRHRLLPGPARRGDRLCAAALRPRPGRPDHHLRHAAGARRAARRRPRAADALRPGRQADKTGAAESGGTGDAGRGDRERTEAAGVSRRGPGGGARLRHRAAPRGPDPARLDPCRRHRDLGPAAERTGAALPRSEIRHAGDPVQHEMGRARGPRQIRLPRPEDADRARCRGKTPEAAQHRHRSRDPAARRCAELRDAGARRRGRRVPGGKPGHAAGAGRHAARPLRGHHRAGGAVSPGPDGEHPDLLRPQARRRRAGISASDAGADPEGNLRRHHLSGTGDADRPGDGRLFARRRRPVAPRHGQEDPLGDGKAARHLRRRRHEEQRAEGARPTPSSNCWQSSPITASTRATPRPTRWCRITPPT